MTAAHGHIIFADARVPPMMNCLRIALLLVLRFRSPEPLPRGERGGSEVKGAKRRSFTLDGVGGEATPHLFTSLGGAAANLIFY
jgi:hypothetical protein